MATSRTARPLFDGDQPSEATKAILQFCEQFEEAGQRTGLFMAELKKAGLLMDGEVAIQPEGTEQPFIYRGFQMVDEEKLRELRGDELRKMNQNGLLPLMFAHLFSLSQTREIFARQVEQGKGPINLAAIRRRSRSRRDPDAVGRGQAPLALPRRRHHIRDWHRTAYRRTGCVPLNLKALGACAGGFFSFGREREGPPVEQCLAEPLGDRLDQPCRCGRSRVPVRGPRCRDSSGDRFRAGARGRRRPAPPCAAMTCPPA